MNRLYGYVPVSKDYAPELIVTIPAGIVARKRSLGGGPVSLSADTFAKRPVQKELGRAVYFSTKRLTLDT